MLTCRSLRSAVLTSGLLLIAALTMEALAAGGVMPPVTTAYLGLFLLFSSIIVLAVTVLRSLLPTNAVRLNECNH